jgi:hypothetical protein
VLPDKAPGDPERVPAVIVPETVEALLENAKALADGEQDRGASLKQRAGWLLGFIGVTLSLLLGQAREFAHSDLGSVGKPLAAALVLVALVFILDAARWALKTLAVVRLWHVDAREAMRYPNWGLHHQEAGGGTWRTPARLGPAVRCRAACQRPEGKGAPARLPAPHLWRCRSGRCRGYREPSSIRDPTT